MGDHLIDGQFQSDKYPWCEPNFVPLKITVNDPNALKLLKKYAELRRPIDAEFADDLLEAIRIEESKA